ncbi:hypothetical protein [Desulfoplanes sp.]
MFVTTIAYEKILNEAHTSCFFFIFCLDNKKLGNFNELNASVAEVAFDVIYWRERNAEVVFVIAQDSRVCGGGQVGCAGDASLFHPQGEFHGVAAVVGFSSPAVRVGYGDSGSLVPAFRQGVDMGVRMIRGIVVIGGSTSCPPGGSGEGVDEGTQLGGVLAVALKCQMQDRRGLVVGERPVQDVVVWVRLRV